MSRWIPWQPVQQKTRSSLPVALPDRLPLRELEQAVVTAKGHGRAAPAGRRGPRAAPPAAPPARWRSPRAPDGERAHHRPGEEQRRQGPGPEGERQRHAAAPGVRWPRPRRRPSRRGRRGGTRARARAGRRAGAPRARPAAAPRRGTRPASRPSALFTHSDWAAAPSPIATISAPASTATTSCHPASRPATFTKEPASPMTAPMVP